MVQFVKYSECVCYEGGSYSKLAKAPSDDVIVFEVRKRKEEKL